MASLQMSGTYSDRGHSYFTELTFFKGLFYLLACGYVLGTCLVVVAEPFMTIPCDVAPSEKEFENPGYDNNPCRSMRYMRLLFLTLEECDFGRRLVGSVIGGGVIGWERRQSDRPAGIRTMALVSLGSCLFTLTSAFAFIDGPMNWDASRVSAAIPSGVGFLGAGLIFKEQKKDENGDDTHTVRGLTTAASLWLSAAVGIACGGQMYFVASFSIAIILVLLRFGPRYHSPDNNEFGIDFNELIAKDDPEMQPIIEDAARVTQYVERNSFRNSNASVRSSQRVVKKATFSD